MPTTRHRTRRSLILAISSALGIAASTSAVSAADAKSSGTLADELLPPTQVAAGDQPIDLGEAIGHAAPFYGDIDGDGVKDLLVGQFRDGKLRLYRNTGTDAQPKFDAQFTFFNAGGGEAKVPYG